MAPGPRCSKSLFGARVEDSYVGDFEIDRYGDTTLTEIGFYRIEGGRLRYRTAISPPPTCSHAGNPAAACGDGYRPLPGA